MKKCIKCSKEGIKGKICNTCYSREYRKTKKGKDGIKKYNTSQAARDANKRFRDKNKKPKKVKLIEKCGCGCKVLAKGLCTKCYHRKRSGWKGGVRPNRTVRVGTINKRYLEVLDKVKEGFAISASLKSLNINRSWFYNNITPSQKDELLVFKILSKPHNPKNTRYQCTK